MKRHIYFRADASVKIGYGHFIRTLALADILKEDYNCTFFTSEPSEYQIRELERVCNYVSLKEETKLDDFLSVLKGTEIVVLDNYFYTTDYQKQIKAKGCKLVCIDDMHDKHYVADVIINHGNVCADVFDCEPYTQLCLGNGYKLLRKPFLVPVTAKVRNNVAVVNLGGGDPFALTDKIVSLLLQAKTSYKIVVILGDTVYLSEQNRAKVEVRCKLSAEQMAKLFETSAFGILPASTVSIEAASRGLPLLIGYQADNQEEGYKKAALSGRMIPLGNLRELNLDDLKMALSRLNGFKPMIPDYSHVPNNLINVFRLL